MHLDDSSTPGEEWLFGSTIALVEEEYNDYGFGDFGRVYLWKVKLDSNHDPDSTELTCVKIEGSFNNIIGLKQTLVGGKLYGMMNKHDKEVFYFEYDWSI